MELTAKRYFGQTLTRYWPQYLLGTLTLLVTNVTEVLTPKFIQWSLDQVAAPGEAAARVAKLQGLVAMFAVSLVIAWGGRFCWRQLLARRTHVAGRDLKLHLWDVLRFLPLPTFHRYPIGDLMSRATGDWSASRTILGFTLVLTLDLIFFTVLAVSSMLLIDVEMTLYCLAVFPLLPRLILKLARREHDQHRYAQEKLSDVSHLISQALSAIRMSRATASDGTWQRALAGESREYADRRFEVVKTGWRIFPLGALPTIIAYAVLLYWGVQKILAGGLTIGEFVALQSYVLMLQAPLFELGDCIAEWQRGFASLGRLCEIFNLQRLVDGELAKKQKPKATDGVPVVALRGLTYAYPGAAAPVLRDVRLTVAPGETVGIAGPIGAGKSTLLRLVAGLTEAPAGAVHVDGEDVPGISRAWLAREVTMVPQRAFLFAGTIRYNLELDERFDEDELWNALAMVRLDADVRNFPGGIDTWVGEWGINLSGGQKQRLALARALLRDRHLLLLDDCLSAVDAVTEEAILEGLKDRLGGRRAIIWVAHRMSTLRLCDRVFELEGGVLRESSGSAPSAARTLTEEDAVMQEAGL